jgi:mannose-6-phosphate isomerase-like protein (cupin superfamily)
MAAEIQTFRFDEAKGREVGTTRGRGVDGGASPDLKVVLYPIDTGNPDINLRFGYDQIGDGFFTPRHRHNFDQFRYVVSGEMNIAEGVDLHEGECGYFPEGTHYGPLLQKGAASLLVMQFPGPNGSYRIRDLEKRAAMDALRKAGGFFEDGIYKIKQPDGHSINKDSYEAVWEQHMGRPITYAAPRYQAPIIMRPPAFGWIPDLTRPGVEIKHLGSFTEYETSISLWRLAPGTVIPGQVLAAPELRCVLRGDTVYDGKRLDINSCYYIPEGLHTKPIESVYGAEILAIAIPKYARANWAREQAGIAA